MGWLECIETLPACLVETIMRPSLLSFVERLFCIGILYIGSFFVSLLRGLSSFGVSIVWRPNLIQIIIPFDVVRLPTTLYITIVCRVHRHLVSVFARGLEPLDPESPSSSSVDMEEEEEEEEN